jgi:hypothetical protein
MVWWLLPALFIASFVVNRLLQPRVERPKLGTLDFPTVEEGRAIPVVYGTSELAPSIVWFGDVKKDTGDDGYTAFYARMHGVLCWGPLDELIDVSWDKKSIRSTRQKYWGGGFWAQSYSAGSFAPTLPLLRNGADQTTCHVAALTMFGGEKSEGGVAGALEFFWGTPTHAQSVLLTNKYGAAAASRYRRLCHFTFGVANGVPLGFPGAVMRNFHWCNNSPYPKPVRFVVRHCPAAPELLQTAAQANLAGDANPVEILVDLLTNPSYGLGLASTLIDLPNFRAVAATLRSEAFGLSVDLNDPAEVQATIEDVLQHIDGVLRTDPTTGLLQLKLARADYDPATLLEVTEQNARDLTLSRGSWRETVNEVRLTYREFVDTAERRGLEQGAVLAQNLANQQATGEIRSTKVDFPFLTKPALAARVAQRYLRAFSVPLAKLSWKMSRQGCALAPGDVVKVTWPRYGVTGLVVRVTAVRYGTLEDGEMELDAIEDVFGVTSAVYAPPPPTTWTEPVGLPVDTAQKALLEMPYPMTPGLDSSRRALALVGRAAPTYEDYDLLLAEAGGAFYEARSNLARFTPVGTLAAPYVWTTEGVDAAGFAVNDLGDLSLLLPYATDAGGLVRGDNIALIVSAAGQELVTWRTFADNGDGTLGITDVVRGVWDTVPPPVTHPAGAIVYFFRPGQFEEVRPTPWTADLTIQVKPLPRNEAGQLLDTECTAAVLTTKSRAQAPYPPGRVRVAGTAIPQLSLAVAGDVSLSWTHRNRVTQGAGVVRQDDATAYGIEGTVTKEVLVGGTVIGARTEAGLVATAAATYTATQRAIDDLDGTKPVRFRLTPKNGALTGTVRETPDLIMAGYGMTYGQYYGGV